MRVAEIMTRDPEVLPSDFILKDAALKMQQLFATAGYITTKVYHYIFRQRPSVNSLVG